MSKQESPNITYGTTDTNGINSTGAKQGRRGGPARPLGPVIGKLTKRAFGRRGFASGKIVAQWAQVVGDNLASLSTPERITYPRGKRSGGTLHLRVESGSIAVELQHLEPVLLERINAHFGYRAVEQVRLIQAPLTGGTGKPVPVAPVAPDPEQLKAMTDLLADVEDSTLKQSLERLAMGILRRDGRRSGR